MIEFIETYSKDGIMRVSLRADGMPERIISTKDYAYTITVFPLGNAMAKSRSCGNGSVRYYHFNSYSEAQEHGIKWAKRKIAEESRAAKRRSEDEVKMRAYLASKI